MSFTRVSARFAWPSAGPPRGGRYRTEAAGARTRHNRNSNRQQSLHTAPGHYWQGKALQFGHTRVRNGPPAQVPLTEAGLNGVKKGPKGSGFVKARATAIVCTLRLRVARRAWHRRRDKRRTSGRLQQNRCPSPPISGSAETTSRRASSSISAGRSTSPPSRSPILIAWWSICRKPLSSLPPKRASSRAAW